MTSSCANEPSFRGYTAVDQGVGCLLAISALRRSLAQIQDGPWTLFSYAQWLLIFI